MNVKDNLNYSDWIGGKVTKMGLAKGPTPKPFKSGLKVNTVKSLIDHPQLRVPAFTFEEDDSYVRCATCKLF